MLSRRVRGIGLSPTLRINALTQELRARGEDVLDFSAGQPDFDTPDEVKSAGRRAIDENRTRYTANDGLLELRTEVARLTAEQRGVEYAPDEVLISPGAKASLYFAFMALVDSGDEVLLPTPYWVSYPEQIALAGGTAVQVPCDAGDGFRLRVERLAQVAGPRARVLVLNAPSNPTGACCDRDELERIAAFCVERDIRVIADEIYSRLLFDGREYCSIAALGSEIRARAVVVDGWSKTWAMTGWRLGWAVGPREVVRGMARLQSHCTSNAASISQYAGLAALRMDGAELDRRRDQFQRRRDVIVERLRSLPGVRCAMPDGSFYAFPDVSGLFGSRVGETTIDSGEAVTRWWLETAKVAVVPGEAFGSPEHVRFSYACSLERIGEGLDRIAAALDGAS